MCNPSIFVCVMAMIMDCFIIFANIKFLIIIINIIKSCSITVKLSGVNFSIIAIILIIKFTIVFQQPFLIPVTSHPVLQHHNENFLGQSPYLYNHYHHHDDHSNHHQHHQSPHHCHESFWHLIHRHCYHNYH